MKISSIFFFFNLILFQPVFPETKTFVRDYTYDAGEADSKLTSRTIALEQVKRALLEELGVYIQSRTEVENFMMKKDEILSITAGITSTVILEEKWNGEQFYLKAKIDVDPDDVIKQIDVLRKDTNRTNELEEVKKIADDAMLEIDRLKKELEQVKTEKERSVVQEQYTRAAGIVRSADLMRDAFALFDVGEFEKALDLYSQVINLNPNNYLAYHNRGCSYARLGDLNSAMQDLNRSISLNSRYGHAYFTRSFIRSQMNDNDNAFNDLLKAIELDPNHAMAHYNLGVYYLNAGDQQRSLAHFKKSARLGFPNAQEYLKKKGIAW